MIVLTGGLVYSKNESKMAQYVGVYLVPMGLFPLLLGFPSHNNHGERLGYARFHEQKLLPTEIHNTLSTKLKA